MRSHARPWFRSDLAVEQVMFGHGTPELVHALWVTYVRAPLTPEPVDVMLETENLALEMERAFGWSDPGYFRWVTPRCSHKRIMDTMDISGFGNRRRYCCLDCTANWDSIPT